MNFFGASIGDNDFTYCLFEAIKYIVESQDDYAKILDSGNPNLIDIISLMASQYSIVHRTDLWVLHRGLFPWDISSVEDLRNHNFKYIKKKLKLLKVRDKNDLTDKWNNGEGVGLDVVK
jgi:hypothetical protein